MDPEKNTPEKKKRSRLPSGLEPTMVENLRSSRAALEANGIKMTLREVYDLEVESREEDE